jgi:hypothetical protein
MIIEIASAEEAIVVAFRQETLLPLDDVLGCLKDTIPSLSRSVPPLPPAPQLVASYLRHAAKS